MQWRKTNNSILCWVSLQFSLVDNNSTYAARPGDRLGWTGRSSLGPVAHSLVAGRRTYDFASDTQPSVGDLRAFELQPSSLVYSIAARVSE